MLISCGPSILHLQKENSRDRIGTSDGRAKTARFEPIPLRFTHMSSADAAVPLGYMAAEQLLLLEWFEGRAVWGFMRYPIYCKPIERSSD